MGIQKTRRKTVCGMNGNNTLSRLVTSGDVGHMPLLKE
jgi:hypothetical protein